MTSVHEDETVDHICKQAYNKRTAESLTWRRYVDNMHWTNLVQILLNHIALVAALIIYSFGLYPVPMKGWTIVWISDGEQSKDSALILWNSGFYRLWFRKRSYRAADKHLAIIIYFMMTIGVTGGAHRLWAHRSYKAKLPLRIMLMIFHSGAGMNSIFHWVKDHRVHHKYSETDADPHNAQRGFFFSHVGWLVQRRHPEYLRQAREVDMNDVVADPVVMFDKKWHSELKLLFCFIIPTVVPIVFWDECVLHAVLVECVMRYVIGLNFVWSVNSLAHLWGTRPYNRLINPSENAFVSHVTCGEGSHNYHHTFPWDYKASEFAYSNFNLTTLFIDAMAKLGWAHDRREPSPEFVNEVVKMIGHKSNILQNCREIYT